MANLIIVIILIIYQAIYVVIIWGKSMKNHKKVLLVSIIGIVLVLLIGFIFLIISRLSFYYYLEIRPSSQENTTWSSEDGRILLYVDKGNNARIYFEQSDTFTQCYFVSSVGYSASVYSWEAYENERLGLYEEVHYETWNYSKVRKDTFTITVEKTTFLKIGDKITFYKVEEKTGDG